MEQKDLYQFSQKLQYKFCDLSLLDQAFRHRSYVNEQAEPMSDNERLEFLGDAVLNLITGHILMEKYPDLKEGELTMVRSSLVSERGLASIARTIDLGTYIRLGKGEAQASGREKNSILADTFEAVIAAVYIDGGFDSAFYVVESLFASKIDSINLESVNYYKSRLQELLQSKHLQVPRYTVIGESGPDHEKTFKVQLQAGSIVTEGVGKSKKMAEQDAARIALEKLGQ